MEALHHTGGRPRLIDFYCGGGGAGMGYHRAGFEVCGVDILAQPNYPFAFHRGDAISVIAALLRGEQVNFTRRDGSVVAVGVSDLAAAHASPPCSAHTMATRLHGNADSFVDLIEPTRAGLLAMGLPWIIENVEGAPIRADMKLCGTQFGLKLIKHRLFEVSFHVPFDLLPPCDHSGVYDPWHGAGRSADKMRQAIGIDWLPIQGGASRKRGVTGDLFNAIPPAFTEHLGRHLMNQVQAQRAAA